MKKETKVKCDVKSCKHNEEKLCNLDELDISCTCDKEKCEDKQETICKSFEKGEQDDNNREELEYEILEEDDELDYDEEPEIDSDDNFDFEEIQET